MEIKETENTNDGEIATSLARPRIRTAPTPGFGITSERRRYKLMAFDGSGDEKSGRGESFLVQAHDMHGRVLQQRKLTETGLFSDRPRPEGEPLPTSKFYTEGAARPKIQMPFLYTSGDQGLSLTRGQFLELSEAPAKAKERREKREAEVNVGRDLEERWRRDPRMDIKRWTVHYHPGLKRCYFVEKVTGKAQWKPPCPEPKEAPSSRPKAKPVSVEPAWRRILGRCWRYLPRPPRWWWSISREVGTDLDWVLGAMGLGAFSPCPCWVDRVSFKGENDEVQELVEALGLTQSDLRELKSAFRDCDWNGGGDVSVEEFHAWIKEPCTPFSRSLFRLADMDDSGLIDFAEFIKVICCFSTFNEDDVLKFGFELFDEDSSGTIDEYEFASLVEKLNLEDMEDGAGAPPNGNLEEALKFIDQEGEGTMSFVDFQRLCRHLPIILYPAFRLQSTLQRKTLGAARWNWILWNINRHKRIDDYKREHHGRRPPGEFKAGIRVVLEKLIPCFPRLPACYPDYLDVIRPAATSRPGGTYGEPPPKEEKFDFSVLQPPSFE